MPRHVQSEDRTKVQDFEACGSQTLQRCSLHTMSWQEIIDTPDNQTRVQFRDVPQQADILRHDERVSTMIDVSLGRRY